MAASEGLDICGRDGRPRNLHHASLGGNAKAGLISRALGRRRGKAADAAARAADVAAASLSLESERWHTESAERDRVHARWVEVDLNTFSGVPQVKVVCTNRGPMSIANVVFHLSIDSSRYQSSPSHCAPQQSCEVLFDVLSPVTNFDGVQCCATFADMDGRSWARQALDGRLEPYDGNTAMLFA